MFLGVYLEALDEELVALQPSISKHKPASTLKVEELEEETQSGLSLTEVGERDYIVRQFLYLCIEFSVADVYIDTLGKFGRVTHLAHIRWKVPLDRTHAKPA